MTAETPTREARVRTAIAKIRRAMKLAEDAQVQLMIASDGTSGLILVQLESAGTRCRDARERLRDAIEAAAPHVKSPRGQTLAR